MKKYSSMMTSKGQVTIPVEIRRKLRLKPGQAVSFDVSGDVVKIGQPDWRRELEALGVEVRAHMKRKGLKPLSNEELSRAIDEAGSAAAHERYQRSLS